MHDAYNHWIQLIARYPDLHDVYHRGVHDFESLEGTDRGRFFALMHGEFRNFEEIYHLKAKGHLEEDVWRGWEAAMREVNGYPGVQAYWRSRSHWYSEEFAKYINQLQQTAKPPRLYREAKADE